MTAMAIAPDMTGYPVANRPIAAFTWRTGDWFEVFERQVALIQSELAQAHLDNRIITYLSCPISSDGGGHFATNVEIANFTAQRLRWLWGEEVFVLNPAAYQLESETGTRRLGRHTREPGSLDALLRTGKPGGGDYMRMWTRVLVEDHYLIDSPGRARRDRQLGGLFDAFYFIGPSDVHEFFTHAAGHAAGTARHAAGTAGRMAGMAAAVGQHFTGLSHERQDDNARRRREYVRYYTVRAGASASLGSRDEWNIFTGLNLARTADPEYGPGELIAGFYDGRQLNPADAGRAMPSGYEVAAASIPDQGGNHS